MNSPHGPSARKRHFSKQGLFCIPTILALTDPVIQKTVYSGNVLPLSQNASLPLLSGPPKMGLNKKYLYGVRGNLFLVYP